MFLTVSLAVSLIESLTVFLTVFMAVSLAVFVTVFLTLSLTVSLAMCLTLCLCCRKNKQRVWSAAVKYLSMNESRVRQQIKTINGEECNVWCWIDVSIMRCCEFNMLNDSKMII